MSKFQKIWMIHERPMRNGVGTIASKTCSGRRISSTVRMRMLMKSQVVLKKPVGMNTS